MTYIRTLLTAWLLVSTTGCITLDVKQDNAYAQAIADAAVIEPDEIVTLPVIDTPQVKVVTWTNYPDSYQPGQYTVLNWGDTWVTLDQAVQTRCRQMPQQDLISHLQKLLGLPLAADNNRSFVTLKVDRDDLYRPCADPSLNQPRCGTSFPDPPNPAHQAWYARQTSTAYQAPDGFPWTRLGYTYNWQAGDSEVGPAEFVIRKGARVKTLAVTGSRDYCAP